MSDELQGPGSTGTEVTKWADPFMYERDETRLSEISVKMISATRDPFGVLAIAMGMYEGEVYRDLIDITDEQRERAWENAISMHPKVPLEFISVHLLIEGLGRDITHQMVRQRTARFVQESMRFAVVDELNVPYPPSLGPFAQLDLGPNGTVPKRKVWDDCVETIRETYRYLVANGMPAEDARKLLPTGTPTRIHWNSDLRNLAEQAGSRLCTQAQFEWREIWGKIVKAFATHGRRENAWQWERIAESKLFRPICYATGTCPFATDFDRVCSIKERVKEGQWEDIRVGEWLLDPDAAKPKGES